MHNTPSNTVSISKPTTRRCNQPGRWAVAVLALSAAAAMVPFAAGAAGTVSSPPTLRPDGVGAVRIGMSSAEVNAALGHAVKTPQGSTDQCYYLKADRYPELGFMMQEGVLRRIDLRDVGMTTADGVRQGDSLGKVQSLYGDRLKTEPAKHGGPQDWTLTVMSPDGQYATRFETKAGFVEKIYAGFPAQVDYVEGCA